MAGTDDLEGRSGFVNILSLDIEESMPTLIFLLSRRPRKIDLGMVAYLAETLYPVGTLHVPTFASP